jgi:phage head maturation protease
MRRVRFLNDLKEVAVPCHNPAFPATSIEDTKAVSYLKEEAHAVGSALFIASITHVGAE